MTTTVLLLVFFALLFLNIPIAVSIALAVLAAMVMTIDFVPAVTTIAQRMATGIDSFALLAIPLFVLSGYLMGGIAKRLIEGSKAVLGGVPGGLAFSNILSCMVFGSVSGSALAATSAVGSFMTPEMEKAGYQRGMTAAVTVTGSVTGLLIPPSNVLIVFAVVSGGVSISALFAAGYGPGILLGLLLMGASAIYAFRMGLPVIERMPIKDSLKSLAKAVPSVFMIVVVIGGILAGIFTATEAGAIAVVYAAFLSFGLYKELTFEELPEIFIKTARTTGVVMLLIGISSAMGWLLAYENIPAEVSAAMISLSDNPIVILILINMVLLLVGAFLDITPAVLIFTPIFYPVAASLGMSPVHFGIMLVLNLSIGLCTPPVGSVLFVGSSVCRTDIADMMKPLLPLYLVMIVALMLITFVPALSEFLPTVLGLMEN